MEALIPDPGKVVFFFGLFLVMYAVLKRFLFEPYLDALADRDASTSGAGDELDNLRQQINAAESAIAEKLATARATGAEKRDEIISSASSKAAEVTAAGQEDARKTIEAGRSEIDAAEQSARSEIKSAIPDLAERAAERLMEGVS